MSHRPLALVFGLTIGDYLLWSWSLNGSHDVLALVSGLTLPPLAVACLWLLVLTLTHLVARSTRRSPVQAPARRAHADPATERETGASATATPDQTPASTTPSAPSPGKLAA